MTIIYRATNLETEIDNYRSFRPKWFDKRKCFKSLIDNVSLDDKVVVIFDGSIEGKLYEYVKLFSQRITLINIDVRSNEESLKYCYEYSRNEKDSVYFLEDDYIHLPNSLNILKEGIKEFGLVTLYDHLDRYTQHNDITEGKEYIKLTKSTHWRTAESTTCTWACSENMLSYLVNDAKKYLLEDRAFFRNLINKNIRLFTPVSGKSTHCDGHLSPCINWEDVNERIVL